MLGDEFAEQTTVVVSRDAPAGRLAKLKERCRVITCPLAKRGFNLKSLLRKLGRQDCTHLLVEGGGETNAAFIEAGLARRVAFLRAENSRRSRRPDGRRRRGAAIGQGAAARKIRWRNLGPDLMLTARVADAQP